MGGRCFFRSILLPVEQPPNVSLKKVLVLGGGAVVESVGSISSPVRPLSGYSGAAYNRSRQWRPFFHTIGFKVYTPCRGGLLRRRYRRNCEEIGTLMWRELQTRSLS